MAHEHEALEQAYGAYLDALRAWRVALLVHLEEAHGLVPGAGVDADMLHRLQHPS